MAAATLSLEIILEKYFYIGVSSVIFENFYNRNISKVFRVLRAFQSASEVLSDVIETCPSQENVKKSYVTKKQAITTNKKKN